MTFSVVRVENGRSRVIGTVWAHEESEAKVIASTVSHDDPNSIVIRPTEENETKLNLTAGAQW